MNEAEKERLIKKDLVSIENRVRHAFNQGYEMGLKENKEQSGVAIRSLEAWKNVQKEIYSQIDALDEIHEFRDKKAYFKALDIINKYLKEVEE